MSSPLMTLVETSQRYPTAECFVVSEGIWQTLLRDAKDYLVERSGMVSTVDGLGQMAIGGVPVTRLRGAYYGPFIEVHYRDELTMQALIARLLG